MGVNIAIALVQGAVSLYLFEQMQEPVDDSHDPKTVIHKGSLMNKIQAFYVSCLLLSIGFTALLLLSLRLSTPCLSSPQKSTKLGALDPKNPSDKKALTVDKIFVPLRRSSQKTSKHIELGSKKNISRSLRNKQATQD